MIIDLQRRIAEIGRIRIGQQVANSNGRGKRPAKLTTFRLTSADRTRIQHAAGLYGGTPQEWDAPAGKQWEVITESDALNVIVPPSDMAFSQHYELWSGGGCQRRCDGQTESISDGPCLCDPDKRECGIHTRLSVMLRDLPGLGVWRIDTSGWYAALELQGAVEVVQMAAGRGQMLPARLRLEQRMIKRPGSAVKRFAVPVLDIEVTPAQLLGGGAMTMVDGTPGTIAIESPRPTVDGAAPLTKEPPQQRSLTPVPETVQERPVATVAEQAAAQKPSRRRAQSIPRTGLAPRTRAQAAAKAALEPPPPPDEEPPPDDMPPASANDPLALGRRMHALFREADCNDRDDRLTVTRIIVGRNDIQSSNDLTRDEMHRIVDRLGEWQRDEQIDLADKVNEMLNVHLLAAENS